MRFLALSFLFLFTLQTTFAQKHYGIDFSAAGGPQCHAFTQAFHNKAKEVNFSIAREGNALFFETNDKNWFSQLFQGKNDGIALDLVPRDRYACNYQAPPAQIKGLLLAPVYSKALKQGLRPAKENRYRVKVGTIPQTLANDDLEFNILFLNDKKLCLYYVIYNLPSYPWDLLDMGMYLDSLTYSDRKIPGASDSGTVYKFKSLTFTVPFEKNKTNYAPADIKPLYDSLRLTDFNIKSIDIHAYASVEGSTARNAELQQGRAESIIAALQSFQKPTIATQIETSENWVEFLKDIEGTPHAQMGQLPKSEIKKRLVGQTSAALEPLLKNHRKAIIRLELDKKDPYKNERPEQLVQLFNGAVKKEDLAEALAIQNSLFEKMRQNMANPELLRQLEVPEQSKFLPLLLKNAVYRSMLDEKYILISRNQLRRLKQLDPNNAKLDYNIAALNLKIWRYNAEPVDARKLKQSIEGLAQKGIERPLIQRMLVNYHIIKAEQHMRKREYDQKDRSVAFINATYNDFPKSDFDYLSLAQFLTYYANNEDAVALLNDKAQQLDVNSELLFYYINLTLIDQQLTATEDYRRIMLNAHDLDPQRFCNLFASPAQGGVTFQLLEDPFLKQYYCENCGN
ncbi:hypothetical protein [Sediminicola luteus]|uniref:OmpA-like domain-containing protein n=1 Tax=Sediminicola luteus TaxID=319238 RepID=A0A2A4GBR5_9FLAO|nr:hypothetical protein [Sediminicola luteus]PCE66399.1 hypothetical protein B7P33_03640 [Sediminicola luteus]